MPKIRKVKRRKSFKVNINRKRLRNKLRKLPAIECTDIKNAWDSGKSTRNNLREMGLSYDANETLKIPNFKRETIEDARKNSRNVNDSTTEGMEKLTSSKFHVAANLEADARAPRERCFRLPDQQVRFVTYLMDKYGEDYRSMARDPKNYYQLTWRQIRAKINTFKGVPEQYAEYLLKKGEIVLDDHEPLAETKRKIARSNVEKYCAAKPKKINKPASSQWLEEDLNFNEADNLDNVENGREKFGNAENTKKLKLFSDDENDDAELKMNSIKSKEKCLKNKKLEKPVQAKIGNGIIDKRVGIKYLEKSQSSDSEEDLVDDNEDDISFVDLKDASDEELSDDDILDNGEFVSDDDSE